MNRLPRFTRAPSVKELREIYTPTPTDVAFVTTKARGPAQKFALMIELLVYQRLHYFPDPQSIPGAVISHIRAVMKLPDDLVPDISPATLYRYYGALREHLELESQGKHVRHVAAQAMHTAAQTMENPADLTYIRLRREFVYLATILDAYSRRCIGWNLSTRIGFRYIRGGFGDP